MGNEAKLKLNIQEEESVVSAIMADAAETEKVKPEVKPEVSKDIPGITEDRLVSSVVAAKTKNLNDKVRVRAFKDVSGKSLPWVNQWRWLHEVGDSMKEGEVYVVPRFVAEQLREWKLAYTLD